MFDSDPKASQILDSFPLLTGVYLDPTAGAVTASRPAAVLHQSSAGKIREIDNLVIEDVYPKNELDARYAELGWPFPAQLPSRPWGVHPTVYGDSSRSDTGTWASRRFMVQRATINISLNDIRPVEPLVEAFETALCHATYDLQFRALQEVGEMIPLNAVAGAFIAVTGILSHGTALPHHATTPAATLYGAQYNLTEILDRHLGTTGSFDRRLGSRVQGGSSEALLSEGCDAWRRSVVGHPENWSIVKVYRAVLVTDILSARLRDRVMKIFTGSIISRSPSVGTPHGSGFDGSANGLQTIQKIKIWFSESKIQDIAVEYHGGAKAGPYSFGIENPQSQSDVLVLAPGEYVTDIFAWHHHDGWIMGIQFVKNTLELSPIYGIGDRDSSSNNPPVLSSGDSKALLGISGAYTSDSLSRIQAVWRSDVIMRRQRHVQTLFTGNTKGRVYNDLQYLADPANARIVQITGRAGGAVASLRTTYISVSGGSLVRCETPSHGWDVGPLQTMILEEGEYIIGVCGSHNHLWMHQIQFITNKRTHPPFGTENGYVKFNFSAPKTIDGRDMVLHYMVGTSGGCLHSVMFVWAELPL
ncbi:unnamed protein product [Rhizoctonia solani]|nr:unnamed protein product [Rhizoctonia solani]